LTLEIYVSDSTPGGTGTYLYNTIVLDVDYTSKNIVEKSTSVTGKPINRWLGETHEISFRLLIEEHQDSVNDSTFGLSDLDAIRQWSIGYASGAPSKKSWIRDTDGDYFLKAWKVGRPSGLKINLAQGFPNVVGSTLYEVSFKFTIIDDSTSYYTMYRW
jgi:hypothetical protein